jgi:hypothetical protein
MKTTLTLAALAASCFAMASPAIAQQRGPGYSQQQQSADDARFDAAQQRFDREYQIYQQEVQRYRQTRQNNWRNQGYNDPRYNNDDRDEGDYDAARYYREGPRYQERALTADERVYRGRDGKYYCKRSDGTTGLIVGAVAGGVLGNVIDGGHSRSAGTILGAIVGAAAGASIDRNSQMRCR